MTPPVKQESLSPTPHLSKPTRARPRFLPFARPYEGERGIGGFLLLFAFTQIAGIIYALVMIPSTVAAYGHEAWALGEQAKLCRPLVNFETLGQATRLDLHGPRSVLTFPETRGDATLLSSLSRWIGGLRPSGRVGDCDAVRSTSRSRRAVESRAEHLAGRTRPRNRIRAAHRNVRRYLVPASLETSN